MAEPTTYTFELKEVAAALIKQQGITEGRWLIGFEFQLNAGMVGKTPEDSLPAAVLNVVRLQLVRVPPEAPASSLVVSASEISAPKRRLPAAAAPTKPPARRLERK